MTGKEPMLLESIRGNTQGGYVVSRDERSRIDIEDDVCVLAPPKRRYKVRLHIKSVRRGEPVIVVPVDEHFTERRSL